MAHMTQEKKKELTPGIKKVLNKYGIKGSISVFNYSTLVITLRSGPIDFKEYVISKDDPFKTYNGYYTGVNIYWIDSNFNGIAKDCLEELRDVAMIGNYDNSDIMNDYHNVGWYVDINIGHWEKDYIVTK